jgi:uridine kinase
MHVFILNYYHSQTVINRKTSEALGTHHLQATVTMVFKCLRQRSNGLKICLPAVFYMLHAGEGNMKMYSPKSIIFPEGIAREEYDTRG